jgi:O-antigen/teichoic acid export membrane protein
MSSFVFRFDRTLVISTLVSRIQQVFRAIVVSPAVICTFAIRLTAAATAYVLFASVARTTSHADYGAFAIFFTAISACSTVAPLGQQSVAFKYLPAMLWQRDRNLRSLVFRGLSVSALGAVCLSGPTILFVLLSLGRPAISLALMSVPVVIVCTLCEYLFVVNRALGSVYVSTIAKELLWRLMFLLFLIAGLAVGNVMDSYRLVVFLFFAFGLSLLVLGAAVWLQVRDFPKGHAVDPARAKPMEAATYFGITLVNAAVSHLDTMLMGLTVFQSDVPIYFSALRITQVLQFFLYAYSTVMVPDISVAYHQGQFEKLADLSREVGRRAGLLVFVACACVVAFPGQLLALFSPDFASGANVLRILCVGPLILTLGGLHSWIPPLCGLEFRYLIGRASILAFFFVLKLIVVFGGTIEIFALLSSAELCAITVLGIFLARQRLRIWIV